MFLKNCYWSKVDVHMWFAPLGTIPVCQCHLQPPSHHSGGLPATACHTGDAKLKWVPASACLSSFTACLASIYLIMPFSLSFPKCRGRAVFIEMRGLPMFRAIVKQEMKSCLRALGAIQQPSLLPFFNLSVKQALKLRPSYTSSTAFRLCALIVSLCAASQDTARILHN